MSAPIKTDITAICPECAGVMKIASVEPLTNEPRMVKHGFKCDTCLATASFKFPKTVSGAARA